MTIDPNDNGLLADTGRIRLENGQIINIADLIYTGAGARVATLMASGNRPADDPHSRIHQGVMYTCDSIVASLANDASFEFILTTPSDDYPHVVFDPSLDGAMDIYIFEAPTFTGGTSVNVINHNRNSSNVFGGSVVHTPSVSVDGTQLIGRHISGATGPHASGGSANFNFEWDTKASSDYLFRITNRSGNAQRGSIALSFYSAPLIA